MTFSDRIKYYDTDTANICFIDNTIIPAVDEDDVAYVNQGNSYRVCFPNNIENGLSFTNEQYTFNMKPLAEEEGLSPKIVNKNEIVYNDVFDTSTDISYALENSGIKESIIVNEYTGRNSYEFIFAAEGLTPDSTSGSSITFLDATNGEPVYVIQPINIVDSYDGDYTTQGSHITYDNYYEIESLPNDTYLLRMNLDANFLDAESTVYPCIIDPSVWAINYSNASSSYVVQSTGESYVESQLSAGNFNGSGEHLSYIKATYVEKLRWIEPNRLLSATFNVKASSSGYSNSCTINCYDSTINASVSSITYSGLTSSIGTYQSATTFTTLEASYAFNITTLFRQWISYELGEGGKNPAYGFILKGASGASTPGRYFSSTSSSDTYFHLVYEEGEEIEDGFYNIKNVSTGTYLRYNSGGQLYLSSVPSSNDCKWQAILWKNDAGTTTYGTYAISPFNNLNTTIKGVTTNESVTTSTSGNRFRIIRNADGTFRIMPAGSNYARVSNAIGVSYNNGLYRAVIQEYSNINSMKWTLEPVINKFFSEFTPTNITQGDTRYRLNCYGYAFCHILSPEAGGVCSQQPGNFCTLNRKNDILPRVDDPEQNINNIVYNLQLDAERLGYSINEYTSIGDTIEQFGATSRLVALITDHTGNYHFFMQHNDGTWSHKNAAEYAKNTVKVNNQTVYLTNANIQQYAQYAGSNNQYVNGGLKFLIITRNAILDHPHGFSYPAVEAPLFYEDVAGDFKCTASNISAGSKFGRFDFNADVDYFVFQPSSTQNYTLTSIGFSGSDINAIIYDKNGDILTDSIGIGDVNVTFSVVSGNRYFIKVYNNSNQSDKKGDYTLYIT